MDNQVIAQTVKGYFQEYRRKGWLSWSLEVCALTGSTDMTPHSLKKIAATGEVTASQCITLERYFAAKKQPQIAGLFLVKLAQLTATKNATAPTISESATIYA